jgi:prepilin-type N-terminal cleavage/methylation domain-containing protein
MKKRQGFTLVELLAVIVILAIILVIAIPNIMKLIDKMKLDAYKRNEELLVNATRNYLAGNPDKAPVNIGDVVTIQLSELQSNNIIDNIKDIKSNNNCIGEVTIIKRSANEYAYSPYLECGTNYKTSLYAANEGLLLNATKDYLAGNPAKAPVNIGDIAVIDISELQSNNMISTIKDMKSNNNCSGKVTIIKKSANDYTYNPYLDCGTNYKTYSYATDGLIMHLDGYDAPVNGYWQDTSDNNRHAQMVNMAGTATSGYNSTKKTYVFDGVDDHMITSYGNGINPDGHTISIIVKINTMTVTPVFIAPLNNSTQRLYIASYSNLYDMGIQSVAWGNAPTNGTRPSSSTNIAQITIQFVNGVVNLYLNNQYCFSRTYTTYTLLSNFYLGNLGGSMSTYSLNGNIYNVKIYNRVLSSDELLNNYNIDKLKYGL